MIKSDNIITEKQLRSFQITAMVNAVKLLLALTIIIFTYVHWNYIFVGKTILCFEDLSCIFKKTTLPLLSGGLLLFASFKIMKWAVVWVRKQLIEIQNERGRL